MATLRLLILVLVLLLLTAVLSPWIALGLADLGFPFKFSRVWNRVLQVLLVIALVLGWRRLDLGGLRDIGFRRDGWQRDLGQGLAIGFGGVMVGLFACWLGNALVPDLRFSIPKTAWKALVGLAAAIAVGVGEEALFRGVLLRRLSADTGRVAGVLITTTIYAVVHALRPGGSRDVHAWAGVERILALFAPLGEPSAFASVAGLFGLGLVLAMARFGSGSLWLPIGIHAAWVAVFRVGRLFFHIRQWPAWLIGPGWPPLVGGAGGAIALVVTALLLRRHLARRRLRAADGVPTLARPCGG